MSSKKPFENNELTQPWRQTFILFSLLSSALANLRHPDPIHTHFDDSSMMSRKLAEGQRTLVAGVDYANQRGMPRRPADMEDWDWIRYKNRSDITSFTNRSGQEEKVGGNAQVEVDSIDALYHLATKNIGATVLPSFLADRGIESGQLVRLLPDWQLRLLGIYAVWVDKSRRESLTLLFIRFLAEQELC